jgi:23S rRNA (uracil1939-C5)-methyltransferase
MARDLAALAARGYKLRLVQPIDFFPHTFHVESLAIMIQ